MGDFQLCCLLSKFQLRSRNQILTSSKSVKSLECNLFIFFRHIKNSSTQKSELCFQNCEKWICHMILIWLRSFGQLEVVSSNLEVRWGQLGTVNWSNPLKIEPDQ